MARTPITKPTILQKDGMKSSDDTGRRSLACPSEYGTKVCDFLKAEHGVELEYYSDGFDTDSTHHEDVFFITNVDQDDEDRFAHLQSELDKWWVTETIEQRHASN